MKTLMFLISLAGLVAFIEANKFFDIKIKDTSDNAFHDVEVKNLYNERERVKIIENSLFKLGVLPNYNVECSKFAFHESQD